MPKHILVTGSNGQLGSELKKYAAKIDNKNYIFYFTDKKELDITDENAVKAYFALSKIDTIINCAAYTAVDKAEEERDAAERVNHQAVKYLAKAAKRENSQLIHISTDYVYDGTKCSPYTESDSVNPKSTYGYTKLKGEEEIVRICPPNATIIRTSWVYSVYGENFVKTMLRLGKERNELGIIYDQIGSPTNARDLAYAIMALIDSEKKSNSDDVSVYHYSNEGVCSWFDFAKAIFELSQTECKVNPIMTSEYPTLAERPKYSVLNKNKIKEHYSLQIPYWRDSLRDCIDELL